MSTEIASRQPSNLASFRGDVEKFAATYLARLLGSEAGQRAGARVGLAFTAAVRAAKNPDALMSCSRESVATAVAMSALTNLMPGGPAPAIWLVPKGKELQWWLSHRGVTTLCLRAGYQVLAVAVHVADSVRIEFGEVVEHTPCDESAATLKDLAGVYLTVRRLESGIVLCRPWVSIRDIEKRQAKALTRDIWNAWPVEMAQKTAIKWAISRGLLPIEGLELNLALAGEPEDVQPRPTTPTTASADFGLRPSTSIPDDRQIEETPADPTPDPPVEPVVVEERPAPRARRTPPAQQTLTAPTDNDEL